MIIKVLSPSFVRHENSKQSSSCNPQNRYRHKELPSISDLLLHTSEMPADMQVFELGAAELHLRLLTCGWLFLC